ncbi:hypothetical protein PBI_SCTP2_58 [Salicola phage SCTP-2]|nr:hypothetical protein PBI_SCTP2_58 [Salicola phage SCTP-2]
MKYIPKESMEYIDNSCLHHYIRHNLDCFKYSYKFTEQLKQTCVLYCPKDIRHIHNPSENTQDYAIRLSPDLLFDIENPTQNIILKALKESWDMQFFNRIQRQLTLEQSTIREINKLKLKYGPPRELSKHEQNDRIFKQLMNNI